MESVYEFIGKFVVWVIGPILGLAFFFLRFSGIKWIESKFAFLLIRKTNSYEKKCEILHESWKKIVETYSMLELGNNPPETVNMAFDHFRSYIDMNRVYIDSHIREKFRVIDEHMERLHRAWIKQNQNQDFSFNPTITPEMDGKDPMKIVVEERNKIKELMDDVESDIKKIIIPK